MVNEYTHELSNDIRSMADEKSRGEVTRLISEKEQVNQVQFW